MGFERKLRRKQFNIARKRFMRDFKQKMKQFRNMVACSACGKQPAEGENIDDWKINQQSENIDLLCVDCFGTEEEWQDEV